MWDQIESKIASGFTTIKLKIGALDTEEELSILREIRERYTPEEIELRVDANGAFSYEKARDVLKILKDLTVHSIEQPIKKGNWSEMALLAKEELTPIALDEELIGVYDSNSKFDLLSKIRPQYIVLKPSLHGGISGCRKWIQIAEELQIGWWMTSALESNVGLDAIAQFTGEYDIRLPQGLGTGGLFVSNIERNLHVEQGYIYKNQF
jgi:L-alanine-DL-glutamate epimerase-like enolase superfamily enzyme